MIQGRGQPAAQLAAARDGQRGAPRRGHAIVATRQLGGEQDPPDRVRDGVGHRDALVLVLLGETHPVDEAGLRIDAREHPVQVPFGRLQVARLLEVRAALGQPAGGVGGVGAGDVPEHVASPRTVRILLGRQPIGGAPRRLLRPGVARGRVPRGEAVEDLARVEDRGLGPILVDLAARERAALELHVEEELQAPGGPLAVPPTQDLLQGEEGRDQVARRLGIRRGEAPGQGVAPAHATVRGRVLGARQPGRGGGQVLLVGAGHPRRPPGVEETVPEEGPMPRSPRRAVQEDAGEGARGARSAAAIGGHLLPRVGHLLPRVERVGGTSRGRRRSRGGKLAGRACHAQGKRARSQSTQSSMAAGRWPSR